MEWLQSPSYWWALFATVANITMIAMITGTLIFLWFGKHVHAWSATIAFVIYVVLFFLEPPTVVKAYLDKDVVHPQAALRTWMFVITLTLLIIKSLRTRTR